MSTDLILAAKYFPDWLSNQLSAYVLDGKGGVGKIWELRLALARVSPAMSASQVADLDELITTAEADAKIAKDKQ